MIKNKDYLLLKCFFIAFTILTGSVYSNAQRQSLLKLTVRAGGFTRINTPVFTDLPGALSGFAAEDLQLVEIKDGRETPKPFQLQPGAPFRLCWILDGETPAGSERQYQLVRQAGRQSDMPIGVTASREAGNIHLKIEGQPVLSYAYEAPPLPEGVSEMYVRDGFIHPLWSPKGEVLTRIQPPDHYHHYGLWNPWTRTEADGRAIDYWNLNDGQGTVRHKAVASVVSGPVYGGFSALLEHIDLTAPDPNGRKAMLNETWEVKAWRADPENEIWLVDFVSRLNPATEHDFIIKAYRYQGFGFRATEKWDDNTATLLTDKGKGKSDGNATRARWCDVNGVSDLGTSGVLFMTHPHNYNFPEQLRIWPTGANGGKENVFFNFNPAQEQDWVLKSGHEYVLQYRMMIYDGKITAETAERYWRDFADPPEVEVATMRE